MQSLRERYIVDEHGQRVAVIVDWEVYQQLLDALEELEAIRAYDAAKASGETPIPLEQALQEIEQSHK
ncbi:MAG: hypothetical protein ABDI19_03570 [Armatimonadota bacterium]